MRNSCSQIMHDYLFSASLPSDIRFRQLTIDLLSMSYMIIYIPLIWPADWVLARYGLYITALFGTLFVFFLVRDLRGYHKRKIMSHIRLSNYELGIAIKFERRSYFEDNVIYSI